jgi:preprotein translocase subunit SecG
MKKELKLILFLIILIFLILHYSKDINTKADDNTTNVTVEKPSLTVFYPSENNLTVSTDNITFFGRTNRPNAIYFKLNDDLFNLELLSTATWTKKFNLIFGDNKILIYVCANNVCSDTQTFNVYYNSSNLNQNNITNTTTNTTLTNATLANLSTNITLTNDTFTNISMNNLNETIGNITNQSLLENQTKTTDEKNSDNFLKIIIIILGIIIVYLIIRFLNKGSNKQPISNASDSQPPNNAPTT